MPRTHNPNNCWGGTSFDGTIVYNATVEAGGKGYQKARRQDRQAMLVSVLYWIAGAYALMWAAILWVRQ